MTRRTTPSVSATATKRCAIYTRKSTSTGLDSDFNSLDAQREACLAYIQRQPGWTLVDERYDDGGFTGANTDRPAFQRLMADIDAGKVDVIVVYKVDRLSRSLLDFVKVMERLGTAGASFVSVTQNFSTADAMGRLTMNLLASFAEFERSMIAERTRDKIAASRRKGKWTGGPVPFGYSAKDKKLVVNEVEARVVREAFALFLQHRQMAKVARELNERGLLPRGSSRPSRLGLRWTKDSIARVLRSPLYAGLMMYGDELHPGEQPRIIDDATYRQATRILEGAGRELRFTGLNPDYVLRGLLRCAGCGQAMCPGSTSKNGKTYRFYRCSTRDKHGKDACSARPLPARALEELVAERITAATADVKLVQHIERSLRARIEAQRASLAAIRADLPGRVASASAAASKLADELGKLDGRARELVEAKLRVEADRLVAAERQLAETERDLADLEVADAEATWMLGALRDFTAPSALPSFARAVGLRATRPLRGLRALRLANVWALMTPENRGRLLRALVASVRVNDATGEVEIELVNFSADTRAEEAAA
jgi:site-specific DNA recombinase